MEDQEQRNYALRVAEHCMAQSRRNRNLPARYLARLVQSELEQRGVSAEGLAAQAVKRLLARRSTAWSVGGALVVWIVAEVLLSQWRENIGIRALHDWVESAFVLFFTCAVLFYFRHYRTMEEQEGEPYASGWTWWFMPLWLFGYSSFKMVVELCEKRWDGHAEVLELWEPIVGCALCALFIQIASGMPKVGLLGGITRAYGVGRSYCWGV